MERLHCNNEQLLRYLDGESDAAESRMVLDHLDTCWACRKQAFELEATLTRISTIVLDGIPLSPDRIAAARQQFAVSASRIPVPVVVAPAMSRWRVPLVGAIAAALILSIVFVTDRPSAETPVATLGKPDLLSAVRARETATLSGNLVLEQRFTVQYLRVRPEAETLEGEIRVVSDTSGRRLAAHWIPAQGKTEFALWRSDGGDAFRLASSGQLQRVKTAGAKLSITDVAISEASDLEENLVSWLISQEWKAVSLSDDFASFIAGSHGQLGVQRAQLETGEQVIVFSATRTMRSAVVHATFSARESDHQPRLRGVRVEKDGRVWELRIRLREQRVLTAASLARDTFEPKSFEFEPRLPGVPPVVPTARSLPEPQDDFLPAVVEAYVVAHRTNALVQEQLRISSDNGTVRVVGVVATASRKRELVEALTSSSKLARVRIDLTDASAEQGPLPQNVVTVDSVGSRAPADAYVAALFEHVAVAERENSVREYGNRAVLLANRALGRVWALRDIAQQFDPATMDRLSEIDRSRVEMLVLDHLAALQFDASEMRAHVMPLLARAGVEPRQWDNFGEGPETWQSAVSRSFASVMRIHRSVYALFTADVRGSSAVSDALSELQAVSSTLGSRLEEIRPLVAEKR